MTHIGRRGDRRIIVDCFIWTPVNEDHVATGAEMAQGRVCAAPEAIRWTRDQTDRRHSLGPPAVCLMFAVKVVLGIESDDMLATVVNS